MKFSRNNKNNNKKEKNCRKGLRCQCKVTHTYNWAFTGTKGCINLKGHPSPQWLHFPCSVCFLNSNSLLCCCKFSFRTKPWCLQSIQDSCWCLAEEEKREHRKEWLRRWLWTVGQRAGHFLNWVCWTCICGTLRVVEYSFLACQKVVTHLCHSPVLLSIPPLWIWILTLTKLDY